jgi:hypothetical protein
MMAKIMFTPIALLNFKRLRRGFTSEARQVFFAEACDDFHRCSVGFGKKRLLI